MFRILSCSEAVSSTSSRWFKSLNGVSQLIRTQEIAAERSHLSFLASQARSDKFNFAVIYDRDLKLS